LGFNGGVWVSFVRPPGADSGEKHEPASDIDTAVVDSLKVLDAEWPIREAEVVISDYVVGAVGPANRLSFHS
jgi:hypothetical protein